MKKETTPLKNEFDLFRLKLSEKRERIKEPFFEYIKRKEAKKYFKIALNILILSFLTTYSRAQIGLLQDFTNNTSATIGTFQGIQFKEAGFSGLFAIQNTNGKEFWTVSDRGVNVDAANANPSTCRPTYDKIYAFPNYAPKIHRIRVQGDSIQILQTITMKRPNGTTAPGLINPTGFGSTAAEVPSTDTVLNCANFNSKTVAKDAFGIDSEGILVDNEGNFWICEEGGPTIWKLNPAGIVIKRFTPYANLVGSESIDVQIDTVFKYRKNNRGFEGISITPNGKIYAIIQSPILYPTKTIGEGTRIHRIIEIDPTTNTTRMFAYLNDGIIGTGADQIRLRDWKIGDMAAINDHTFLVLEAAQRGLTDIKRMYLIDISGATNVTSGLYSGVTLEALVDAVGLASNAITPVTKTLFMDLLANGWNPTLDKAEGLAIINDSTIAIGNDNDYGQFSPLENGIATATNKKSHVAVYGLQGANKITNYQPSQALLSNTITGPTSSQSPYVLPFSAGVTTTSILSVTDAVGSYNMAGIPDGLGAFDNNDGTFTLLINHELSSTLGAVRAHGAKGAFVSKWTINKSDLSVINGSDLIQNVYTWNTLTNSYDLGTTTFSRFCSADLPKPSAFYNNATGLGTQERIYLNGEETGAEGRAFGHIVTGSNTGVTYQLPYFGKFSFENSLASPYMSDKTIVASTDDGTGGQVYVYIGTKTNTGTDIDKAGLNNGKTFGVKVTGFPIERVNSTTINNPPNAGTHFDLVDIGFVQNITGAAFETASVAAGLTSFSRPEDGTWDPSHPNDFYFLTTDQYSQVNDGVGTQVGKTRVYRLRFADINNPELGGEIEAVLDGSEGLNMLDNTTMDNYGHLFLQEDVGNQQHNGKIWQYTVESDELKLIAKHDVARFGDLGIAATAPYSQDEESSGIIDMEEILGPGNFLMADQAHYTSGIPSYAVEGGQLLALYNPDSYAASTEINVTGNGINILDGDLQTTFADNTEFGFLNAGSSTTRTFIIQNTGISNLSIEDMNLSGFNSTDFSILGSPIFPIIISPGSSQSINIKFIPLATGVRMAELHILSNDVNESDYNFAIQGTVVCPILTATISANGPTTFCSGNSVILTSNPEASYLWSNGTTTQSITVTTSGTFNVTRTNQFGCSGTSANVTTVVSTPIEVSATVSNITCNGNNNGVISTSITGGIAPFTYLWSNDATTSNLTGLTGGEYTVTVKDANGCSATNTSAITEPQPLVSNFNGSQLSTCGTGSGTIIANVMGGTTPYNYLWSNGSTSGSISGLNPGTYSVTITDANSCSLSQNATVVNSQITSLVTSTTKVSCNGLSDGSICVNNVIGGSLPIAYSWNTSPEQTTACATGLPKGFYSVTATDANGCSFTKSGIRITQPTLLVANAFSGSTNATVTAQGGTRPYNYLWSNGKTTRTVGLLSNGTYTVIVTDAKGCTATSTVTIGGSGARIALEDINIVESNGGGMNVYPNPTDSKISILFTSEVDQSYSLSIVDITGKTVFSKVDSAIEGDNTTEFNFENLARGIYAISIQTDKSILYSRVVVE